MRLHTFRGVLKTKVADGAKKFGFQEEVAVTGADVKSCKNDNMTLVGELY